MRISIIVPSLIAEDAIGQCILHQLRFFRRRGDEVKVYVNHPLQGLSEEISQFVEEVRLATLLGGHDKHFAQSDIYVYHYPSHYPMLESIKGLERGAVILYYHNVTPPQLWKSSLTRHMLQHSIDTLSSLVGYIDLIVTDSKYNAEQLIHEHGCELERIKVLPLAVPLKQFSPGSPNPTLLQQYNLEGRQVILYVGRMASNKRIDLLVEALPLVQKSVPSALLLLVGDNVSLPYQETCQEICARAEELGVVEDVIFSGIVEEVAPYFRLADVYATASLHEGFGVPLIEAMASGVPVVASRATAHPWVIGEAGLLVEPDNAKALAKEIIRILTDEQLRNKLIRRGLAHARNFSLEQYQIGWGQIIDEVTNWLPSQPFPRPRSLPAHPVTTAVPSAHEHKPPLALYYPLWFADIKHYLRAIKKTTDIINREYTVRSKLPIIGPLIAWIRRHLTSHLWEPYVAPTFERQVALNQQLVKVIEEIATQLHENNMALAAESKSRTKPESSAPSMERRLRQIEAQLSLLSAQVTLLQAERTGRSKAADMAIVQEQVDALRSALREALPPKSNGA